MESRRILMALFAVFLCIAVTIPAFAKTPEKTADSQNGGGKITVYKIAENTYLINDTGISAAYLLVGNNKALVIDSGLGKKEFRSVVEKYAQKKPIAVALTHNHIDHAGAVGQFDTLYMNKADLGINYHEDYVFRKLYGYSQIAGGLAQGTGNYLNNIGDNMSKDQKVYYLDDGDVIDLGGRTVTYYWTPGHTPGSGCYVDSQTKFMFTGDMVNPVEMLYFLECTDLDTYYDSVCKIEKIAEEQGVTKFYNGHETTIEDPQFPANYINQTPGDTTTIPMIEAIKKAVNEARNNYSPYSPAAINIGEKYIRKDGSTGVILLMTTSNKVNPHPNGSVITTAEDFQK